jgi:hypothetical protein
MKTNVIKHAASTALDALDQQKLGSSLKKICDLKSRDKDIIDRQEALSYKTRSWTCHAL